MTLHMIPTEAALSALLGGEMPGLEWVHGDDLCDCTFQRIGEWTNPYIAETHRVRLCCFERKLRELLPELNDFIQDVPAFYDENARAFTQDVRAWDGETAMPRALWYRQIARMTGDDLATVRAEHAADAPPEGWAVRSVNEAQTAALMGSPVLRRSRFARLRRSISNAFGR